MPTMAGAWLRSGRAPETGGIRMPFNFEEICAFTLKADTFSLPEEAGGDSGSRGPERRSRSSGHARIAGDIPARVTVSAVQRARVAPIHDKGPDRRGLLE
ncbi:hypothetical protein GCM10027294_22810 [Marinactinospora endophytica]